MVNYNSCQFIIGHARLTQQCGSALDEFIDRQKRSFITGRKLVITPTWIVRVDSCEDLTELTRLKLDYCRTSHSVIHDILECVGLYADIKF